MTAIDGTVTSICRAGPQKEGKDKNMEPEAMSQDDRDALVQWVKEKVEKETIMVTISEGEDVEYKFMLGWLRKQKMSERKVEKRLAKPSKLTKDQRERLVADYKVGKGSEWRRTR